MRRNAFLLTYIACALIAQGTGPWATLAAASVAPGRFGAEAIVSLLVPVALIVLALARGEAIGQPRLYLFPAAALVASGVPFFIAWTLLASGHASPDAGTFGPLAFVNVASVLVPLLLHAACCLRGGIADKPLPAEAALQRSAR